MSGTLSLVVPLVIESLGEERARIAPLGARRFMVHGDEPDALLELKSFLEDELREASPASLADLVAYGQTGHAALRMIVAPVSLGVPERNASSRGIAVDFACIVLGAHAGSLARPFPVGTPESPLQREALAARPPLPATPAETWIAIPILDHVFRLPDDVPLDDDTLLDGAIAHEVLRLLDATTETPLDVLSFLPPTSTRIHPLTLEVRRPEKLGKGSDGPSQHEAERQRREDKRLLLERMGRRLEPKGRPPLRDAPIEELARLLSSSDRLAVLVRGPELAGKSAVIEHALGSLEKPAYAIPLARFLAGEGGFGEWQTRVQETFDAAETLDAILYIEDLGSLALERPQSPIDLAAAFAPYLESRRVRFVGEIRDEELDRFESRHRRLAGTLLRVRVDSMSARDTIEVLSRTIGTDRATARTLSRSAIETLVSLVTRYLPGRALPGEALRTARALIDSLPAARDQTGALPPIEREALANAFAERVGIPTALVRDELPMPPEEVARALGARVIGQTEAVEAVARTLGVVKADLPSRDKPIATFLFVGPTGTGKTELARSLAQYLFGSSDALARFDMSEFMDPWAAERLIRGTDREDGLLTRRARERPFSVLLLDEIEKAHPSVFDLLLQVLGEGRLTDARGKTASFTSCIVIMTSNLGARSDRPLMGFGQAGGEESDEAERQRRERYLRAVRDHFRPELLNRIDRIVPFRALSVTEAASIARLFLRGIERRAGLVDRKHTLTVDDDALLSLIDGVMQAGGGARALRRTLEDTLVIGLSRLLASTPSRNTPIRVGLLGSSRVSGLEHIEHAGLLFTVPARSQKTAVARGPLDTITLLRRRLSRWARLGSVEAIRTEVARLVAEVARTQRHGAARTEGLERRLGVLESRIEPVNRLLGQLESEEERALSAIAREESADDVLRIARRTAWELEQAIWTAVRSWSGDDEDTVERTVMVVGRSTRALGLFLLPLLERERHIELTTTVHLPAGIGPEIARTPPMAWPSARAWSPYLEGHEALTFLRSSTRLTSPLWGHRPASVFLYAEGTSTYTLLLPLEGLIRFRHEGLFHDLMVREPKDLPHGDQTKLPELDDVPSTPNVLIDLDAGLIRLAGVDEPIELDPPDEEQPFAERSLGRWVDAMPRMALARQASVEGL